MAITPKFLLSALEKNKLPKYLFARKENRFRQQRLVVTIINFCWHWRSINSDFVQFLTIKHSKRLAKCLFLTSAMWYLYFFKCLPVKMSNLKYVQKWYWCSLNIVFSYFFRLLIIVKVFAFIACRMLVVLSHYYNMQLTHFQLSCNKCSCYWSL